MEPSRITAKAIRASLLAIATATSLNVGFHELRRPCSKPVLMGLSVEEDSVGADPVFRVDPLACI